VLKKSFCTGDQKFFGLQARFSSGMQKKLDTVGAIGTSWGDAW
jgi:hypothetical protein